jgi:predicted nuclease of predicted toxin-antitoxin system
MRIFADHCVHKDVVDALCQKGIDIERAIEVKLHKAADDELFKYALKSNQVLLTFDKDFGNIIRFNIPKSPGVVILYTEGLSRDAIIDKIVNFFQGVSQTGLRGSLFIIEASRMRVWKKR